MRLYLAVAVLVLAFVAYTEAQEATVQEKLNQFGETLTELGKTVAEKAKTAMADFNNNENVQSAKNWFQEQFEKLQNQFN